MKLLWLSVLVLYLPTGFERRTAGALEDVAMKISISHTKPDVGTGNFYFCAIVTLIPANIHKLLWLT